ncbi:hypothetical protein BDZ89DRAFT_1164062 [Hymenopellis radicata]|nr:hypothetical protein BDZ89DRAFT_1164062 [Hymenopellis radicata]
MASDLVPTSALNNTSGAWSDEDCYCLAVIDEWVLTLHQVVINHKDFNSIYRKIEPHHAASKRLPKFPKLFRNRAICSLLPRQSAVMQDMLADLHARPGSPRIAPSDYLPASTPPSTPLAPSSPDPNTNSPHLLLEYTRVVSSWMAAAMQTVPVMSNFSGIPQALAFVAEGIQNRTRTDEMLRDTEAWISSYGAMNRHLLSPQIRSLITYLQEIINTVKSRSPLSRFFLARQDQQLLADGAVQLERATQVQIRPYQSLQSMTSTSNEFCSCIPTTKIADCHILALSSMLRGYTPDDSEVDWIKVNATALDAELDAIDNLLCRLNRRRTLVAQQLMMHSAALAPIRSLPNDVLLYIFMLAASEPTDSTNILSPPWSLSHVCGLWRTIALSSSPLWSTLIIDCSDHVPRSRYIIKAYLSRSHH